MIKYLASRCEKRCNKVIIINKSANSPTISGKSLKAGIHKSDSEELGSDYQEYILSVENYNNYCRELLDLAIEQHNLSLAKQSLILFRKNMHAKDLGTYFNYKDKEYEKKYKGEAGFMESVVGLFSEKKAQKMQEKREEYNSTLIDHSYRKNKFKIYWDWTDRDDAKKILNSAIDLFSEKATVSVKELNRSEMAEMLGITRPTLNKRINQSLNKVQNLAERYIEERQE